MVVGKLLAGTGSFCMASLSFAGCIDLKQPGRMIGIYTIHPAAALKAIGYGVLWGVGGLTFGLSMRYMNCAGTVGSTGYLRSIWDSYPCSAGRNRSLLTQGLILLLAVAVTLVGIALVGYAGSLRSKNMSEEERRKAIKDFALKKGLLIALFAGVMSACCQPGTQCGVTGERSGFGCWCKRTVRPKTLSPCW